MATERERFQIEVELLGVDNLVSNSRAGVRGLQDLARAALDATRQLDFSPSSNAQRGLTADALAVERLTNNYRGLLTQIQAFQRQPGFSKIQEAIDFQPRITQRGTTNLNDVRTQQRLLRQAGPENVERYAQLTDAAMKARSDVYRAEQRLGKSLDAYNLAVEKAAAAQTLDADELRSKYLAPVRTGTNEPVRSQIAYDQAVSRETSARARISEIIERNSRGELLASQTLAQLEGARRQLVAASQARAVAEERLTAESGGFGAQFSRGFRGATDRPYAEQLGQAVKFSAFYGAAYRIQSALLTTFQDALQEGIDFEQGLSDMTLATGQTREQLTGVANQLAKIAAESGTSPAAGLAIGARAIGLYGLAGAGGTAQGRSQQDFVAQLSTQVVSKLALGSKVDPVTLQQNLAAITQALGLGPGGQIRVADLDAYFAKRFGTAQGDTLEAGAQSASVGIAAGFTLEQIQAAAALMISRTGQSSNAVGGYLAQIFSRGGEGSLTSVANKYGIETQGRQLSEVFADLAKKYKESSATVQAEISAAFGRGKVQNAVVALLQDFQEVGKAAKDAQGGGAAGALDRSFAARINNIGGQIAELGGNFKEFARLFGQSGLLSVLGLGVEVLNQLVTSASALLRAFNELPEAIRVILGLLLAARGARALGFGGNLFAGASLVREATAANGLRAGAGAFTALAGAAVSTVGPIAAVTAGIFALGKTLEGASNVKNADRNLSRAIQQAPGYNATPDELLTYASLLRNQAREARKSNNGIFGHLGAFFSDVNPDEQAKTAIEQAKAAEALAKRLQAATRPSDVGLIPDLSEEGINAGLTRITALGGTAAERLNALRDAINGLSGDAAKAASTIDKDRLGVALNEVTERLPEEMKVGIGRIFDGFKFQQALRQGGGVDPNDYYNVVYGKVKSQTYVPDISKALPGNKLADILTEQLKAFGITDFKDLNPDIAKRAADVAVKNIKQGGKINSPEELASVREAFSKVIAEGLLAAGKSALQIVTGANSLSDQQITTVLAKLREETATKLADRGQYDFAGRAADLRGSLNTAKKALEVADHKDLPIIIAEIRSYQQQLVGNEIDRLEALRHAAVSNATSQAQATRIGQGFIRQEIAAVVRGGRGSTDQLVGVLQTAGKGAIAIARQEIEKAIKVAIAANAINKQIQQAAAALSAAVAGPFGQILALGGNLLAGSTDPKVQNLQSMLEALQYVTPSANPDQIPKTGSTGETETAAERRAARLAADAARRGGDIAAAKASIAQAQAALSKAKKGTVEYYNALASYYQARDQLRDAIRNYQSVLRQLRIDTTDPVATAREELITLRKKLLQDIRNGKAKDVVAQDQLDVKNAQAALEAAQFDQRLSDVQTAEELGKISHTQYIQYLQNEHNRLSSIAHKTRQQIDQLNQIDKLLKDAQAELQGQFNLGDIKLPTPYEVRRYVKTQVQSIPFALGQTPQQGTTTIYIDGADTGAVKKIIDDYVGKGTRVLTTAPRRN